MRNLIISEFIKLKRYSILWIGIVAVLFAALLAVFQTTNSGGPVPYEALYNNIIWNNFSLAFPFITVLISGFIINREYTDHTLKTMLTVPISFRKMLTGKLIASGIITAMFAALSFVCTLLLACFIQAEGMSIFLIAKSFVQILGMSLCNYIAVLPIITFFCRKQNGLFSGVSLAFFYGFCGIFVAGRGLSDFYPVTAGLGVIGYTGDEMVSYNPVIGCLVLLAMLIVSAALIRRTPSYDKVTSGAKKKPKRGENRKRRSMSKGS